MFVSRSVIGSERDHRKRSPVTIDDMSPGVRGLLEVQNRNAGTYMGELERYSRCSMNDWK